MAFVDALDVDVGDPTKASDHDQLADNTEFNREKADAEHDFDISTGDGAHKDVTADSVVITSSSTDKEALDVVQNGALADGEHAVRVYTNANQQESALAYLHSDNASSDHGNGSTAGEGGVLVIRNDGSNAALKLSSADLSAIYTTDKIAGTGSVSIQRVIRGSISSLTDDAVLTLLSGPSADGIRIKVWGSRNGGTDLWMGEFVGYSNSSNNCVKISSGGAYTMTASTSDLSGTTGVDGHITVSCHSGNGTVEIENRTGATINVRYEIAF